jgi:hypothetical protein
MKAKTTERLITLEKRYAKNSFQSIEKCNIRAQG